LGLFVITVHKLATIIRHHETPKKL